MRRSPQQAVESLVRRVTGQDRTMGKEANAEAARQRAVRVCERSEAEKRDGKEANAEAARQRAVRVCERSEAEKRDGKERVETKRAKSESESRFEAMGGQFVTRDYDPGSEPTRAVPDAGAASLAELAAGKVQPRTAACPTYRRDQTHDQPRVGWGPNYDAGYAEIDWSR